MVKESTKRGIQEGYGGDSFLVRTVVQEAIYVPKEFVKVIRFG